MLLQVENTSDFLVIVTTIVVVLLALTLIFLFLFIQSKKKQYFLERVKAKEKFARELSKSSNEIRESALKNLSWEIHDNVGQLLSVSKMELTRLEKKVTPKNKKAINEVTQLVSQSLQDLRALSKSMNPISIQKTGFLKALQLEVERYNRLKFIKATIHIVNTPFRLDKEKETILFRIVQEFITNAIKHAKATELHINLTYAKDNLEVIIKDNGIGFNVNKDSAQKGIGLLNMKGRAELIKSDFKIFSEKGKGTTGYIKCNKEKIIL